MRRRTHGLFFFLALSQLWERTAVGSTAESMVRTGSPGSSIVNRGVQGTTGKFWGHGAAMEGFLCLTSTPTRSLPKSGVQCKPSPLRPDDRMSQERGEVSTDSAIAPASVSYSPAFLRRVPRGPQVPVSLHLL